jgi:uncharacterized protein YxjI
MADAFGHSKYLIRKQFFKLFGGAFHIYDPSGNLVFYSKQKAFKLKEDISVYSDESMSHELLCIKARNILDFSVTFDVFDPVRNEKVGALKRKGMKSMLKDEWLILDGVEREIGKIQEDSLLLGLVRRFLTNLIPQRFSGTVNGKPVCEFRQAFNPIILKVELDYSLDRSNELDRRLGIAAGILICAIEGRQD